jgi:hypothetical protein
MTSHWTEEQRVATLRRYNGMQILAKPFAMEALSNKVAHLLG